MWRRIREGQNWFFDREYDNNLRKIIFEAGLTLKEVAEKYFQYSDITIGAKMGCISTICNNIRSPINSVDNVLHLWITNLLDYLNIPLSEALPRDVCDIHRQEGVTAIPIHDKYINMIGEDPEEIYRRHNLHHLARRAMSRFLTPREEKVLRMRFGIGEEKAYTLRECADDFCVISERIRQIEAKALRKLRHARATEQFDHRGMTMRSHIDDNEYERAWGELGDRTTFNLVDPEPEDEDVEECRRCGGILSSSYYCDQCDYNL